MHEMETSIWHLTSYIRLHFYFDLWRVTVKEKPLKCTNVLSIGIMERMRIRYEIMHLFSQAFIINDHLLQDP